MRILLLDDHPALHQSLRRILEERPGWEVVAEATDGAEAVRKAQLNAPDVAIIDLGMPLPDALDTIVRMRERAPDMRILVLSMHADDTYVIPVIKAGASGFLLKDLADVELQQAVEDVAQGELFISTGIVF